MKSGLEVLIIQDVSSRVAGASMTVNSGVNKEGKDIYGLAHYCEHMLFLGSKKYSDPTYFVDFITKHNGKFNGYTDFELTGFFFKINSEKFDHGLDIFSRFFIDPSFSAEYVKKEVNSVNSEFERNIQLDSKRKEMVFRDVADQDSLFHRFSTGNTHTLWKYTKNNGIDLRERVLEYYNAHYRPDNMKLVIYGNESIETYKDMVDEKFYDLKKRNDPYDPDALSSWNKLPWEYDQIGRLVLFKTINNHQDLDISFMVEDVFSSLPENPSLYYKVLINYRGKGSLDDLLRSKGLVAGIKSHVRRTHKGFSFFKIRGYITKKGIKHLDQVIHYIFKYLQYVKKKALNKQLYDYVKKIFDLSFFFMNRKKKPLKYLKLMSSAVWKYDKKFYFTLHKILPKYDEEVVKKFGERLVLKNAIILLGNKEFDGLLEKYPNFVEGSKKSNKSNKSNKSIFDIKNILDTKDPFYKTEYGYYKFSEKFVEEIDTKDYSQHLETKNLRLFSNKKKLPKIISLIKTCSKEKRRQCIQNFRLDAYDLTPKKIKESNYYELWYKRDRSFFITKTNLFVKFIFDKDVNDPKFATKIRLLIYTLNHHMRNFMFDESLRQSSFHINANSNGFSTKVFAFSETLASTTDSFFNKLKNLKLTESEFELVKDEMKNQIRSQMNLVPALRAYVNFFTLVLKDYVENKNIIEELENLSLKEYDMFFANLFKKFYVKAFIHGTVDRSQAVEIFENILEIVRPEKNSKPVKEKRVTNYSNLHSDLSGYYIFREKLEKSYNINHAILNFYQIGKESVENMINANMIKALCGYIYFTQLRIKEQLGYTARAKIFSEGNVIYYMILVQGSTKTPDYMDIRIENVIKMMRKRIENTDDKKFEKFKRIIANKIGRRDRSLKSRSFRLWNEIITNRNYFNLKNISQDYIEGLTKTILLEFFDRMVSTKLKKLSVQEFSQLAKSLPNTNHTVRGYKSILIRSQNFLRSRKKFISVFK